MDGMSPVARLWLLFGGIAIIVLSAFYCVRNPDCSFCQFMDAFN